MVAYVGKADTGSVLELDFQITNPYFTEERTENLGWELTHPRSHQQLWNSTSHPALFLCKKFDYGRLLKPNFLPIRYLSIVSSIIHNPLEQSSEGLPKEKKSGGISSMTWGQGEPHPGLPRTAPICVCCPSIIINSAALLVTSVWIWMENYKVLFVLFWEKEEDPNRTWRGGLQPRRDVITVLKYLRSVLC